MDDHLQQSEGVGKPKQRPARCEMWGVTGATNERMVAQIWVKAGGERRLLGAPTGHSTSIFLFPCSTTTLELASVDSIPWTHGRNVMTGHCRIKISTMILKSQNIRFIQLCTRFILEPVVL